MVRLRLCCSALLVMTTCFGYGQETPSWYAFRPNQEIRVRQLPSLKARSDDPSDVLLTALDILFHDQDICCGKGSALEDSARSADPSSLKDIAAKLQGRHLLSDGRPIMVTVELVPTTAGDVSYHIVGILADDRPMLMLWNSHLYILRGVIFDQTFYSDGSSINRIHKLLLLDPRYSDSRREVVFDRDNDDWNNVQGLLLVDAKPQ